MLIGFFNVEVAAGIVVTANKIFGTGEGSLIRQSMLEISCKAGKAFEGRPVATGDQ